MSAGEPNAHDVSNRRIARLPRAARRVPGVVRDVIRSVITKNGPLTKEEVIDKVMKERYVKENTIIVNLQNPKYFKKDKDSKYSPA